MTPQQVYNVKRQIALCGQFAVFTRKPTNEFNEPSDTAEIVHSCKGLFHMAGSHISISVEEKGTVQDRKRPKLLVEYTDTIKLKDITTVNNTIYTVTGLEDVGNAGVLLDISLGGDIDD